MFNLPASLRFKRLNQQLALLFIALTALGLGFFGSLAYRLGLGQPRSMSLACAC